MKSAKSISLKTIRTFTTADQPENLSWSEYCVVWLQRGKGMYYNGGSEGPLSANRVYCFRFLNMNQLRFGQEAEGFIFSFDKTFVDTARGNSTPLFSSDCFHGGAVEYTEIQIMEADRAQLNGVVRLLWSEYEHMRYQQTDVALGLLRIFLVYLHRYSNTITPMATKDRNVELYQRFQHLLESNYSKKMSVKFYASRLAVSSSYLTEVVRKVSGFPTSHHVQQRIIAEAKRKAFIEGTSLKEIAYQLGFECPAYFSRFFKSYSGDRFCDFKKTLPVYEG
jgi:AraC family transcriptional activator of pobA